MAKNYDTLDTDYESDNSGKNDNNLDSRKSYKTDKIDDDELDNYAEKDGDLEKNGDYVNNEDDNETDDEKLVTPKLATKRTTTITTITKSKKKKKIEFAPKTDDSLSTLMKEKKRLVQLHIQKAQVSLTTKTARS
jgi:hypothetical protein